MVNDRDQETVVELERVGQLLGHLPNAVYELEKYGRPIGIRMIVVPVTDTLKI